MGKPVYVVATIRVKAGKEIQAETIFKGLMESTHKEAGCEIYTLHKRIDQPGTYYFIEKWRSQADLEKHLNAPHITAVLAKKDDLLTLLDIGYVSPLQGGHPQKGNLFRDA